MPQTKRRKASAPKPVPQPKPSVKVPKLYEFELPLMKSFTSQPIAELMHEGFARAAEQGIPKLEFAVMCEQTLNYLGDAYRQMYKLPVRQPEAVERAVGDLLVWLKWHYLLQVPVIKDTNH